MDESRTHVVRRHRIQRLRYPFAKKVELKVKLCLTYCERKLREHRRI